MYVGLATVLNSYFVFSITSESYSSVLLDV